jgi:hypothetical protein
MFLSSRAISQANITREYLHKLVQSGYKMPGGPVIISPHGLLPSLYRSARRPHQWGGIRPFARAPCPAPSTPTPHADPSLTPSRSPHPRPSPAPALQ